MPMSSGQSGLLAKLGPKLKEAHEQVKGNETKYDSNLPAGIDNGVARLVTCKFMQIAPGKQNAGAYMFYAQGRCVAPPEHAGGITQVSEILADTPTRTRKTVKEHLDWIYNQLRLFGVDTKKMTLDHLEPTVAALQQAKPFFKFRTWKGQKQTTGIYKDREPLTNHTWNGITEFSENGEAVAAYQQDNSAPAEETPEAPGPGEEGFDQLDALVERADGEASEDQQAAAAELTELCQQAGLTDEEIGATSNWAEAADLIRAKTAEGEGGGEYQEGDSPEEAEPPKKGDVFKFQLVDAKGQPIKDKATKKVKQPIDVEITAVDAAKQTVSFKDLASPKTIYKGIAWDKLLPND